MKTVETDGGERIEIPTPTSDRLAALKIAYKQKHETNITNKEIVRKLVENAKLKDIE